MENCDRIVKCEITKILVELGIPINLQGFEYFRECIFKVFKEPCIIKKVTKQLYPQVGEKFDVTGSVVERCMRHASEVAYYKTGFKSMNKYFGSDKRECLSYKPTNSEIIALVAEFLRMDLNEPLDIA